MLRPSLLLALLLAAWGAVGARAQTVSMVTLGVADPSATFDWVGDFRPRIYRSMVGYYPSLTTSDVRLWEFSPQQQNTRYVVRFYFGIASQHQQLLAAYFVGTGVHTTQFNGVRVHEAHYATVDLGSSTPTPQGGTTPAPGAPGSDDDEGFLGGMSLLQVVLAVVVAVLLFVAAAVVCVICWQRRARADDRAGQRRRPRTAVEEIEQAGQQMDGFRDAPAPRLALDIRNMQPVVPETMLGSPLGGHRSSDEDVAEVGGTADLVALPVPPDPSPGQSPAPSPAASPAHAPQRRLSIGSSASGDSAFVAGVLVDLDGDMSPAEGGEAPAEQP